MTAEQASGLHRPRAHHRPQARRAVLLPLRDQEQELAGRQVPDAAPRRLQAAAEDRLLLLPGLRGRLLQRPGGDGQGGPRPRHLPRRLHLRAHATTPARPTAPTRPARTATATSRRSPSTARSTTSTRPTSTCRRCTPPIPSSRSGTTTRSRTTTPATSPTRQQTDPHLENNGYPRRVPFERATQERLQGLLRGASPDPAEGHDGEPDLRHRPPRWPGRAVPHRPAPVPRSAALRGRAADAVPGRRRSRSDVPRPDQKKWFKKAVPARRAPSGSSGRAS